MNIQKTGSVLQVTMSQIADIWGVTKCGTKSTIKRDKILSRKKFKIFIPGYSEI